jgi:hypothetical protein
MFNAGRAMMVSLCLRRGPLTGKIAGGSRARHCMAEIHGNEAWGTAIITSPCWTGLRPAMSAASHLRRSLPVLLLLLFAAGLPRAEAQTIQPALTEAEAPALPLPTTRLGDFDMMKQRRLIRILASDSQCQFSFGEECQ